MARLFISEVGFNRRRPVDQAPLTIGASSIQGATFPAQTRFIRVRAEAPCRIAIGTNPTANGSSKRLIPDQIETLSVVPGQKIAVITSA